MKKILLLFFALMTLSVVSASERALYFYNSDGARLGSDVRETSEGSNIFEGGLDVFLTGMSSVSLVYYDTPEAFRQGVANGDVYTFGSIRTLYSGSDDYSFIVRCSIEKATDVPSQGSDVWEIMVSSACVDLNSLTMTITSRSQGYYYIKKDLLGGISLNSPDDVLSQLYFSSSLPDVSGDFAIALGLLSYSTVIQPKVGDAAIVLDDNGQCCIPLEYVPLKDATKTFRIPVGASDVTMYDRENVGWFYDINKIRCLYVDATAACTSSSYKVPTAANGEARMQKLYPVEGAKGLFHGKIKAKGVGYKGTLQLVARFASANDVSDGIVLTTDKELSSGREAQTGLNFYDLYPKTVGDYQQWEISDPFSNGIYDEEYTFDMYVTLPTLSFYSLPQTTIKHFEAADRPYEHPVDVIYFVGAAEGWNYERNDPQWWLAPVGEGVYERTLYIPRGEDSFRLFTESGTWDANYCMAAGWPDFNEVPVPELDYNGTLRLDAMRGYSNWQLTNWDGGYLRVRADKKNFIVELTKVDGPETCDPEFYLPDKTYDHMSCYAGNGYEKLSNNGAGVFEGVVDVPAGANYISIAFYPKSEENYQTSEWIYPGYPRFILTTDDLNARGDAYSHTARYYTPSADRVQHGYFSTPDYWEGGDVKVKVDTNTHNITFEAAVSGIEGVRADDSAVNPALRGIYTLTGVKIDRPVDTLPAGIYIIDGVKRIIR